MLNTIILTVMITTIINWVFFFISDRIAYTLTIGGFIRRKTWIQIYPVDGWEEWCYIIYAEGSTEPFFMWHKSDITQPFESYDKALIHARKKLTEL